MDPKRGETIRNRRVFLRLSQADVTAAGGPSEQTVRKIEHGQPGPYRAASMVALDRILRWKPGTVQTILDGTAGSDPASWEAPEAPETRESTDPVVPEVTSAGLGFLQLLDKHYATDLDAAAIRQAVLPFIKKINEGLRNS